MMRAENSADFRPAVKAGSWYPRAPQELRAMLAAYETAANARDSQKKIIAGLVPHAGLFFSGAIAARVFCALKAETPDLATIIVFGAVHTEPLLLPAIWECGAWETPLGNVEVDAELAQKLLAAGIGEANRSPHYQDNAIELQLPIIRHLFADVKILPIAVPPSPHAANWGERAAAVIAENQLEQKVAVIASTDLTHYGAAYGFAPVGGGAAAHQWSKANDARLLELIKSFAAEKIVRQAETDRSACGAGAIAMATAYAKKRNARAVELLAHRTSWEILRDSGENTAPEMFVGYAALLFTA